MSNLRSVKVGRGIGVGRAPSTQDLMIRSGSPLPRPLLFMTLASFGDLGRRMVESVNRRPCVWRTTAVRVHPRARRRGTPRVRANPSGSRGRRRDVAAEVVAVVAWGDYLEPEPQLIQLVTHGQAGLPAADHQHVQWRTVAGCGG